jgi:glycosyltransferase involved in cell wall biosynthesis
MSQAGGATLPTIGLFQHLSRGTGVVVGREVAVDDFTEALLRYGERHRYALYGHVRQLPQLARKVADHPSRASVHDRRELASPDGLQLTAWHDPQFETYTPFVLRARSQAVWPITILHHTLSYKELLHDRVLPLLLARPHAYDAVVTTSSAAEETLRRLIDHVARGLNAEHGTALEYRGRYVRIPLGVDTERFRPGDRAAARARFDIDPGAFVLLWVGRLSALDKADLLPLIQCFAELVSANAGRKLLLICAGSDRPGDRFGAMVAELASHLGVTGAVLVMADDARVTRWKEQLYVAADVFVSPVDNVQESFGLTPIEAMACGIPQVVSDWDGYRDSVVHGETGFLVPTVWADCQNEVSAGAFVTESAYDHLALSQSVVVDMRALSRCVQQLLDEPALRESMASRSRRRAEERYSWPVVVRSYEALWSELAEQARHAPEPARDASRYAAPDYGRFFRHFASHQFDEGTTLRLTERGREVVRQRAGVPRDYIDVWQHLDPALLDRVLAGLSLADEKGSALTVGRILSVMTRSDATAIARDVILRHVLFLMKYGLAREG